MLVFSANVILVCSSIFKYVPIIPGWKAGCKRPRRESGGGKDNTADKDLRTVAN